ncbi:MAG TPA: L-type lectin-domain containing protein [Bryobacteraceae bacterium]|nr:L-type lectin-domain containing protein [Bryobacteraceae bacterium]
MRASVGVLALSLPVTLFITPVLAYAASLIAEPLTSGEKAAEKPQWSLVGAAEVLASRLRLTPATRQTVGAAWLSERQYVAGGFELVFQFQITEPGGLGPGADGFAFVLQNVGPDAMAGRGSAGGFALGDGQRDPSKPGIAGSVAVFFDTYRNPDGSDVSDNYVAICTNGPIRKMRWPPTRLGVGRKLHVRLKDGQVHRARIRYKPPVMTVDLDDGEPEVRVPVDVGTVVDASGYAYLGFTASTGNGYENHDILGWSFTPATPKVSSDITFVDSNITYALTNCLEGRNLCTPREAKVAEYAPGRYRVVLPAHLPWGAAIPNPGARTTTIANVKGYVCLDGASERCGGPEGIVTAPAAGKDQALLIAPERNPGSLIVKSERGQTFFSVNGRKGRFFSSNEGFFEFDVILK